ncbi:MAG: hypothetical protein R3246_17305, partial [Acidimicrobiia bacterium]|nr:hypothetical protein [Acidimicrobiia bacterium]
TRRSRGLLIPGRLVRLFGLAVSLGLTGFLGWAGFRRARIVGLTLVPGLATILALAGFRRFTGILRLSRRIRRWIVGTAFVRDVLASGLDVVERLHQGGGAPVQLLQLATLHVRQDRPGRELLIRLRSGAELGQNGERPSEPGINDDRLVGLLDAVGRSLCPTIDPLEGGIQQRRIDRHGSCLTDDHQQRGASTEQ